MFSVRASAYMRPSPGVRLLPLMKRHIRNRLHSQLHPHRQGEPCHRWVASGLHHPEMLGRQPRRPVSDGGGHHQGDEEATRLADCATVRIRSPIRDIGKTPSGTSPLLSPSYFPLWDNGPSRRYENSLTYAPGHADKENPSDTHVFSRIPISGAFAFVTGETVVFPVRRLPWVPPASHIITACKDASFNDAPRDPEAPSWRLTARM